MILSEAFLLLVGSTSSPSALSKGILAASISRVFFSGFSFHSCGSFERLSSFRVVKKDIFDTPWWNHFCGSRSLPGHCILMQPERTKRMESWQVLLYTASREHDGNALGMFILHTCATFMAKCSEMDLLRTPSSRSPFHAERSQPPLESSCTFLQTRPHRLFGSLSGCLRKKLV